MKKDYIITFATELVVMISGVLIYKLAAQTLGGDGFAAYSLCRRTLFVIYPLLLLGFGIGIPRFIAFAGASSKSQAADSYFLVGAIISGAVTGTAVVLFQLFSHGISFIFFGDESYAYLILPMNLMIIGIVIHSLCYSYFRGKLDMMKANALQLINLGVIPILIFSFFARSIASVLMLTGIVWIVYASGFFVFIMIRLHPELKNIRTQAKELVAYSLQRLPGDFGLSALIALPATFAAHSAGLKEGGAVAFGYSLLSMVGTAFAPLGLILLPQASRMIASGDLHLVKAYSKKILAFTISFTAFGVLVFEIFNKVIIRLYLGAEFIDVAAVIRPILIGAVAYAIYVSVRSIIDAYYLKAMNTKNIVISLTVFIILAGFSLLIHWRSFGVITASLISFYLLAALTLIDVGKIMPVSNKLSA
jgi:O-antigen/teichoic acid export membrane protein